MKPKVNPDFTLQLTDEERRKIEDDVEVAIGFWCSKSSEWNRCYRIKQRITKESHYFYQADMYHFLERLGYEVKIDERGDHLCKVKLRSKPRTSAEILAQVRRQK